MTILLPAESESELLLANNAPISPSNFYGESSARRSSRLKMSSVARLPLKRPASTTVETDASVKILKKQTLDEKKALPSAAIPHHVRTFIDSVLASPAFTSSPASSTESPLNRSPQFLPRRRNTVNDADTTVARARLAENRPTPRTPARRRDVVPPRTLTDEKRKQRHELPFFTEEQEAALRDWKETVAPWDRRRKAIAKADAELYWYHFFWFIVVLNWSIISVSVVILFQFVFRFGQHPFYQRGCISLHPECIQLVHRTSHY
ncbi:uncharacterized protein BT62DRAFT_1078282 [Guyanagaster necrorhizus]|uniref:Uncharacterized protein n=1 Tax=Guyanagaster necrorhizus TaxID=856835 RepID=A0A9P7VNI2_9AGAR|nr:uncharacterized protein BT62DRAFT_1078282 [Guyanagaster necrorhizus MCA 3950]KAG7443815.1 hypothetical protein BT62DRAFT_1078282 [Guyanagaster necrorhizus MCA 3950]